MSQELQSQVEIDLPLADMLQALRQEIQTAMLEGENQPVRFQIAKADLEMQIAVSRDREVKGGIKIWVLSADAKATSATKVTHTLKLSLDVTSATGHDVIVHSEGDQPK
jgi:Trypsin-co-occurring domain 2